MVGEKRGHPQVYKLDNGVASGAKTETREKGNEIMVVTLGMMMSLFR